MIEASSRETGSRETGIRETGIRETGIRETGARSRRAAAGVAVAVCLSLGLSACGSGGAASNGLASKSAQQIIQAVIKNLTSAKSVRMTATESNGTKPITAKLSLFHGGAATGTFSFGGTSGQLIMAGGKTYMNGPAGFWLGAFTASGSSGSASQAAAEVKHLAGKWIDMTGDTSFANLTLSGFGSQLGKDLGALSKLGTKTVGGQSAVGVKASKQGDMWVATTGPGYPIQLTQDQNGKSQTITFSDWNNAGSPPVAPKGAVAVQQALGG
jgi:hypothetical protein